MTENIEKRDHIPFDWTMYISLFAQKLLEKGYEQEFVANASAELFIAVKDMETYLNE
jgi:hypothetical protein